mmetsp:Transcript_37627/g.94321  ORF Transcript_37627/g.94321 Transcript_37627/m.94321 type:complete len:98 (+) Transcript_37627:331-624(+)
MRELKSMSGDEFSWWNVASSLLEAMGEADDKVWVPFSTMWSTYYDKQNENGTFDWKEFCKACDNQSKKAEDRLAKGDVAFNVTEKQEDKEKHYCKWH